MPSRAPPTRSAQGAPSQQPTCCSERARVRPSCASNVCAFADMGVGACQAQPGPAAEAGRQAGRAAARPIPVPQDRRGPEDHAEAARARPPRPGQGDRRARAGLAAAEQGPREGRRGAGPRHRRRPGRRPRPRRQRRNATPRAGGGHHKDQREMRRGAKLYVTYNGQQVRGHGCNLTERVVPPGLRAHPCPPARRGGGVFVRLPCRSRR